jgi:hypothetical protein
MRRMLQRAAATATLALAAGLAWSATGPAWSATGPAWSATGLAWSATGLARSTRPATPARPARLATAPGWRIQALLSGSRYLDAQAVAASGARNAWLLGLVPDPEPTFVTLRWNGRQWASVPLPSRLAGVIGPWALYSNIYTTSAHDTWFFPVLPDRMTPVQYALHWNGAAWAISKVTSEPDTVLDAAVFSRRNVWTFGEAGQQFPNYGPAVVRRWNGRAWRSVSVPLGTAFSVDPVAPADIWALGVSKATVSDLDQSVIVMHWNGGTWSSPRLPAFRPAKKGYPWVATAISASGPADVSVLETPAIDQQTGYSPPGVILLDWNGSRWTTAARNAAISGATGLTPDGHGGFWLTSTDPANGDIGHIIDVRTGVFTVRPAPVRAGYTGTASGIVAVPGTGSFWATGRLTPIRNGRPQTDILRYTP